MKQKSAPGEVHEFLSAMVDGEASDWEMRRTLQELDRDPQLREQWHRHQIIGSALHKSHTPAPDISARIAKAVREEAPIKSTNRIWRPVSQLAVAASVAAVTLFAIQQQSALQGLPDEAPGPEASVAEAAPSYQPVSLPEGFELPPLQAQTVSANNLVPLERATPSAETPSFDKAALDRHIQRVLTEHLSSSADAAESVVPYIREVGNGDQ